MEQTDDNGQLEYVDVAHIRLENLELGAPDGTDFGQEHVQWAMTTRLPDHISGIDYDQNGGASYA